MRAQPHIPPQLCSPVFQLVLWVQCPSALAKAPNWGAAPRSRKEVRFHQEAFRQLAWFPAEKVKCRTRNDPLPLTTQPHDCILPGNSVRPAGKICKGRPLPGLFLPHSCWFLQIDSPVTKGKNTQINKPDRLDLWLQRKDDTLAPTFNRVWTQGNA